jgi:CSLREA domain-containing protein
MLGGCYTVNSFVDAPDENPGDGVCARALTPDEIRSVATVNRCTLRAAVMEANGVLTYTINVPAGTYNLNLPLASGGGRLLISRNMRIQGSGASATIVDQMVSDGVFRVTGGNDVQINHLTIQGGDEGSAGGGIRIDDGTVEIEDVVIRNNFAFTGGGGLRIGESATARVHRSTLEGNSATGAFGGGIWNAGELWVYDSTISNNESNRAGGIRNSGNMRLYNVTVSGNWSHSRDAGTGGISQNGFAILNNLTVTNNTGVGTDSNFARGGGIQTISGRTTVMKNSIVAGNDGSGGPDDCEGALSGDSKYNLIGNTTGCTIPSHVATYLLDVPANLGALASNGGSTQTHLPLATSPARNAAYQFPPPAVDACQAADQRGVPRPQGTGQCDMGAVEYTSANLFVTGFMLVNAESNTDIQTLRNDDLLVLGNLPSQLSVRAVVSGSPGSVVFGFDADQAFHTENIAPFALGGDVAGDYAPVGFSGGEHALTATPFVGAGGTAAAGGAMTIKFRVLAIAQ